MSAARLTAILLVASSAALAQAAPPAKDPGSGFPENHPVMLGITPATTPDRAAEALTQHLGPAATVAFRPDGLGPGIEGVYRREVQATSTGTPSERIALLYSRPYSGNRLWWGRRDIAYDGESPRPGLEPVVASIIGRYASPTIVGEGMLVFAYKDGRLIASAKPVNTAETLAAANRRDIPESEIEPVRACLPAIRASLEEFGNMDLARLAAFPDGPCDGVLAFQLHGGAGKVSRLTVGYLDYKRARAAAAIDRAGAEAALAERQSRVAPPPKL